MTTKQRSERADNELNTDVDSQELAQSLGQALRERRKGRGLTLQQLADQCGLSQPFLSQLENGKAMPSLLALHQVAAALGTTAQELLQPATSADVSLVRGDATRCYELGEGTTACFLVEGHGHQLETNIITAQPGSESGCQLAHDGEEMIYVLQGSISVALEDHEPVQLGAGDAYTYPAATPHEWRNVGDAVARFLFVNTPPTF
ncbi:MAG: XRE family transcriptional regulator [Acidimicrobiia bacterium]|nr:XRE family transcriptional regulator [Acidimicrobiia bacterium]